MFYLFRQKVFDLPGHICFFLALSAVARPGPVEFGYTIQQNVSCILSGYVYAHVLHDYIWLPDFA